ncbi:MAG: glycosyltransferase family 2 protein, partial [Clostridia bacterium]|nr:glycosyltransferase family 2 protein [Clostridia bacterium]
MKNAAPIALIPAYEPSETLVTLTEQLCAAGFRIVIINDGSGPEYNRIFEEAEHSAVLLTHSENKGKGRALKTGLDFIRRNFGEGNSVIVTLDADGQHSVTDAAKVCGCAAQSPGTLVLGCRGFDGNVPARSRFGNTVTKAVYRLSTGKHVSDTQTGLRGFGTELLPFLLDVPGERYEYEMNVLLACARENIPISEVGIETIYFNNNAGSHFDTVKDSFRVYREIIKFAASSFTGFLVDYGMYSLLVVLTKGLGTA